MNEPSGAERRSHPRFAAHLRVRVRDVEMYTANISQSGMQLACAVTLATIIQRDIDAGHLHLALFLPDGTSCVMDSAVRYTTEVDDELLIGIEHQAFDGNGRDRYVAFCQQGAARYRRA